jgi:predicted hydrolase (HD superfamily)
LVELEQRGYPRALIRAVETHAPNRTGAEPDALLERVLFACDELSGLVYACCLVRPNGIDDLSPKSVTKKLKDKAFAAGVDRDDVARGVELLGIERAEHIQNVIDGMREISDVLEIRAEDKS